MTTNVARLERDLTRPAGASTPTGRSHGVTTGSRRDPLAVILSGTGPAVLACHTAGDTPRSLRQGADRAKARDNLSRSGTWACRADLNGQPATGRDQIAQSKFMKVIVQ